MTVGEDFIPAEEDQELDEPAYPTAFGITMTPTVGGIIFAIVGLGAAVFLGIQFVSPGFQQSQQLALELVGLKNQVTQKEAQLKDIAKLKANLTKAKQQQKDLLALFATETTLDTLLLDLNKVIEARNQGVPEGKLTAKLLKFEPNEKESGVIVDGSLGANLNDKLKRQVVEVEVEGSFSHIRLIVLDIERLAPFLLVRDFNAQVEFQEIGLDNQVQITPEDDPKIKASFALHALIPVPLSEQPAPDPKDEQKK